MYSESNRDGLQPNSDEDYAFLDSKLHVRTACSTDLMSNERLRCQGGRVGGADIPEKGQTGFLQRSSQCIATSSLGSSYYCR